MCTLGMFATQPGLVLICLAGCRTGAGAGRLPSAHLCGRMRRNSDSAAKITSSKNDFIKLLRPSTHHRRRSSNARRGSGSVVDTQSSWPPLFWLPEICNPNMGIGVRLVQTSLFAPNSSKPGRHPRPFFSIFGPPLFSGWRPDFFGPVEHQYPYFFFAIVR